MLAQRGYCVFALTYGLDPRWPWFGGVLPIQESARELDAFVDRVRAETGAEKVDLIGHSEGTYMPQYWLKFLGGAAEVERYVAWTPLYDGTDAFGAATLRDLGQSLGFGSSGEVFVAGYCGACPQFVRGSEMQRKLSEGGPAAPGVRYTTVMSAYDQLVVPYTSGVMDDPNATEANNFVLQEVCPNDVSEHAAVAFDPVAARLTLNALDPANAKPVSCEGLPPLAPAPQG